MVYAVVVLTVRLTFVTRRYCIETTGRIALVLARRLPLIYPRLYYKEIRVYPKISSQTLD